MKGQEDQASELLWRHVVDLKYADGGDGNDLETGDAPDLLEMSTLTSLAERVQTVSQEEVPQGQAAARVRLAEMIHADQATALPLTAARPPRRPGSVFFPWTRHAALIVLLLALAAIAFALWVMPVPSSHYCADPIPLKTRKNAPHKTIPKDSSHAPASSSPSHEPHCDKDV